MQGDGLRQIMLLTDVEPIFHGFGIPSLTVLPVSFNRIKKSSTARARRSLDLSSKHLKFRLKNALNPNCSIGSCNDRNILSENYHKYFLLSPAGAMLSVILERAFGKDVSLDLLGGLSVKSNLIQGMKGFLPASQCLSSSVIFSI